MVTSGRFFIVIVIICPVCVCVCAMLFKSMTVWFGSDPSLINIIACLIAISHTGRCPAALWSPLVHGHRIPARNIHNFVNKLSINMGAVAFGSIRDMHAEIVSHRMIIERKRQVVFRSDDWQFYSEIFLGIIKKSKRKERAGRHLWESEIPVSEYPCDKRIERIRKDLLLRVGTTALTCLPNKEMWFMDCGMDRLALGVYIQFLSRGLTRNFCSLSKCGHLCSLSLARHHISLSLNLCDDISNAMIFLGIVICWFIKNFIACYISAYSRSTFTPPLPVCPAVVISPSAVFMMMLLLPREQDATTHTHTFLICARSCENIW
jgi:hypothetical protein